MTEFENGMIDHLRRALAEPNHTVISVVIDGKGGLVCSVRGTRVRDLVDAAQSLLSQAADRLDECAELTPEMDDLLHDVRDALHSLPDPLADDDGDDDDDA